MALTQMQTLILWALLARTGGASFQKDIKPEVKKADREALVKAGLLASEKQGRAFRLEVTDKGWAWAAEHLDADLPKKSPAGCEILQAWLKQLKTFMEVREFALADILGPQSRPEPPIDGYPAVRERVRQAYFDITGGRLNSPALLSELREKLADIGRPALDDALRRMHLEDGANLSGIDNPRDITQSIREGGVDFKGVQMFELWIAK